MLSNSVGLHLKKGKETLGWKHDLDSETNAPEAFCTFNLVLRGDGRVRKDFRVITSRLKLLRVIREQLKADCPHKAVIHNDCFLFLQMSI